MWFSASRVPSWAPGARAPWTLAQSHHRPCPGQGLAASLESSRRQAEFPFSFPSFCYFGAVPRGKTHWTHEAFPEPASRSWGCTSGYAAGASEAGEGGGLRHVEAAPGSRGAARPPPVPEGEGHWIPPPGQGRDPRSW